MSGILADEVVERLRRYDQGHVLRWWDELDAEQQNCLVQQIKAVNLELIQELVSSKTGPDESTNGSNSVAERAMRSTPPVPLVRLPQSLQDEEKWAEAILCGQQIIANGQVGVILVAGGQGVRLGFPHPKGMFPIGPVSYRSVFQIFSEQVLARSRQGGGVAIPYYIMTSDATHTETVDFFTEHDFFGMNRSDVCFFQQGNMPAVDHSMGRLLLSDKANLATSPDGHGGVLAALHRVGLLDEMRSRKIDYLFYHQVDNPATKVCDPAFLGFHALYDSDMSTKVVAKKSAEEKMGIVVGVDGQTQIIEYSDLPDQLACQTDEDGVLLLWAGNTATHVFSRAFLQRLVDEDLALTFHFAQKAVPFLDDQGNLVRPDKPNAFKFERFIFDALHYATCALVLEAHRATEFLPVKNKRQDENTSDTPENVRESLTSMYADWLRLAGAQVDDREPVEISPLFALDADQVREKVQPGSQFSGPILLS